MAIRNISASFTRPGDTNAYTSGDLVANNTTAGSVEAMELRGFAVNNQGSFVIRRLTLRKSGTGVTNAQFRAHLFRADVTAANGDNGAFSTSGAADYLGAFDITVDRAFTDGAWGAGVPVVGQEFMVRLDPADTAQTIYALLEARGAYTPATSEVFTLTADSIDEDM